jgi:hypothetical protein
MVWGILPEIGEYGWLAGLLTCGFLLWTQYLNPLKERVIKTEIEVSKIRKDVSSIKGYLNAIKDKIFSECIIAPKK